jgi:molybdopterin converting factor small subunit
MLIDVELKNLTEESRKKFQLDLPDGISVDDVMEYVIRVRPEVNKVQRFMLLINKEIVVSNKKLEENDLLTVFPPLMGG